MVAPMLEEASCIARCYSIKRSTHCFQQGFSGARLSLAQQRLELGKRFFYGVEVRRVGRQVEKLAEPLPSMSSLTLEPLCEERLSITTICPGFKAGAKTCST